MAKAADRWGYDMIGIADTPGNAMDPWVAATIVSREAGPRPVSLSLRHQPLPRGIRPSPRPPYRRWKPARPGPRGARAGDRATAGTHNLGLPSSNLSELNDGIRFIKPLISGEPASLGEAEAPYSLGPRGRARLHGGIGPEDAAAGGAGSQTGPSSISASPATISNTPNPWSRKARGSAAAGASELETWQIASLDCNRDGDAARSRVGAILGLHGGRLHPLLRRPRRTRRARRVTTSRFGSCAGATAPAPGDAGRTAGRRARAVSTTWRDASRFYGTPDRCLDQLRAARAAGLKRVMFTVSVASDPAGDGGNCSESRSLPAIRADSVNVDRSPPLPPTGARPRPCRAFSRRTLVGRKNRLRAWTEHRLSQIT